MKNDCYGCKKRTLNCHSTCESYLEYRKKYEEVSRRTGKDRQYYSYKKEIFGK